MNSLQLLERVGDVRPVDPALLEATATRLDLREAASTTRGAAEAGGAAATPARRRRIGRSAAVTGLAATAAAVAVAAVLVVPGGPSGTQTAGAAALGRLARLAADQPTPGVPGPGQYMYTSSVEEYTSTNTLGGAHSFSVAYPETRQIWIAPDGSGRLRESFGPPSFPNAHDRAQWEAAGSPDLTQGPTDTTFGPGQLSDGPTDLTTLPTDPKALAAMISSRQIEGGPPGPAEDFTQVGDLLRETDASAALRAALFEVAAGIPGVEALGTVTDHSGRSGVGVAYLNNGVRYEMIFNPADSTLIGEQWVVADTSSGLGPVGTVTAWAVYLTSGVVDSDTATSTAATATAAPATAIPATAAPATTRAAGSTVQAPG